MSNALSTFEPRAMSVHSPNLSTPNSSNVATVVDSIAHRGAAPELWDSVGRLQFDYLVAAGVLPDHRVLDIGCGALRTGVKLVPYLNPNHYFGIDANKQLLDVGHAVELGALGLKLRCPRKNLYHSALFAHGRLEDNSVDAGLCFSVLPDVPPHYIRVLLEKVGRYFKPGAKLHVSYFEIPEGRPFSRDYTNMARFTSFGRKPPYHCYRQDMEPITKGLEWTSDYVGAWGQPDGEMMMIYTKI